MANPEPSPIEVVAEALGAISATMVTMQETLDQQNETLAAAPTKRFLINTNTVVTVLLLIALLSGLVYLNQQGNADEERRQQTRDLIERIDSCVNPDGDCAKRGADGSTKAIQQLVCLNEADLRKVVPERAANLPVSPQCAAIGLV